MARTTIRTEDIADSEITTAKILDGTIATGDMAVDPTNASNLASGSVPTAQLGNVDTSGITANQDDIALLGFKVAANGSLARYNLIDQSIDVFEDASGVDASASTNETRNSSKYYSGSSVLAPTGGTITTVGDYKYHLFTSNGDFVIPTGGSGNIEAVMVAGGAGGGEGGRDPANGNGRGGGGGAGGLVHDTALAVTAQTYSLVIGTGGAGGVGGGASGGAGVNSTGFGWTAIGGGGGWSWSSNAGYSGGSGGQGGSPSGAGGATTQASAGTGSSGTRTAYGTAGGIFSGSNRGGGAYTAGGSGGYAFYIANFNTGSIGGANYSGAPVTSSYGYFGGGGGSADNGSGGGAGAGYGVNASHAVAASGTWGSGGGGGGAYGNGGYPNSGRNGGNGSQGVVAIRYATDTFQLAEDMTLVSNAQTAQSAPTTGDLVITISNGTGTTTVNTDIKAYISRDGSAYTSAVTLASQGTTGGHTILTANGVDLSGITSGTSMRWKIETLNQGASKDTRIQAVSLGWS